MCPEQFVTYVSGMAPYMSDRDGKIRTHDLPGLDRDALIFGTVD